MTMTRKLALWIARSVVRRSAPAAQEWAEASLQEIEQIPDDWAALRWSLSSLCILFERGERPLLTLADLPQAARRLIGEVRKRTISGILVTVVEAVLYASMIPLQHHPVELVGTCLMVAAMLYLGAQAFLFRNRMPEGEPTVSIDAYRKELLRQRDFYRGGWMWSRILVMLVALMVLCLGRALVPPVRAHDFVDCAIIFMVLLAIAVSSNAHVGRKYQRRLDELDILESEIGNA